MKTITTFSLICLTIIQIRATQLPYTPKRNLSGVVSEVTYNPEVIKDTNFGQDIKTSDFYSLNLTNAAVELSDPNDSLTFPTIDTGNFDTYYLKLSPTSVIESLSIGDTVIIEGYSTSGDEFGQTYSYNYIEVHPKTTAIWEFKNKNAKHLQYKTTKVNGINNNTEMKPGFAYYNLLGKNISNTSYNNRAQLITIKKVIDR